MNNRKIRHQFLLDRGTSARLNALAQGPGATKTDIIAEAIRAFLERGSDPEISQVIAPRLDRISRDVDAVRQELGILQREVETVREALAGLVHFSLVLHAKLPPFDMDQQAIGYKRFINFSTKVASRTDSGMSSFAFDEDKDGA
ncbi:MAG: CopG family transcriptional regulator [Alphaproteobacteria bacterium]|nr:CopG family transcriptional regulator [Alphaproteobacteria bacterium]